MVHWLRGSIQVVAFAAAWLFASVACADGVPYKLLREYLGDLGNGSQDHWFATVDLLAKSLDGGCGDTFCEGDYSDLNALSTYCVVSRGGIIARCVWLFAGGHSSVSTKTGALGLKQKIFTCKLPLVYGTTALALVDALAATGSDDPTRRSPLGTSSSIYDALANYLHPPESGANRMIGYPDSITQLAPRAMAQEVQLAWMLGHGNGSSIEPRRRLVLAHIANWPLSCFQCKSEAVMRVSRRPKGDSHA